MLQNCTQMFTNFRQQKIICHNTTRTLIWDAYASFWLRRQEKTVILTKRLLYQQKTHLSISDK